MAVVDKVRFTISVPKAMFKELDLIKQESYANPSATTKAKPMTYFHLFVYSFLYLVKFLAQKFTGE